MTLAPAPHDDSSTTLAGVLHGLGPLPSGAWVFVAPDGATLVEVEVDGSGPVRIARSDLPLAIGSWDRLEIAVAHWLLRQALGNDDVARFSWSDLGRAFGYRQLGARNADLIRAATVRVTTPAIHRRVLDLRPGPGGVTLPERDTVVGLFAFPPVLRERGAARVDPRLLMNEVRLDPVYRPFAPALTTINAGELAAAPTDLVRRVHFLAPLLTERPVDPDRICRAVVDQATFASVLRPGDRKASRAMAELGAAVQWVAARDARFGSSRAVERQVILERRQALSPA